MSVVASASEFDVMHYYRSQLEQVVVVVVDFDAVLVVVCFVVVAVVGFDDSQLIGIAFVAAAYSHSVVDFDYLGDVMTYQV